MSTKKCSCREKEYIKIFCDGTRREELESPSLDAQEPPLVPDGDIPLDLSIQPNRSGAQIRFSEGQLNISDVQSEFNSLQTNSSARQLKLAERQAKISGRRKLLNVKKMKLNERRTTLSERKMKTNESDQEQIIHPLLRKIKKLLEGQVDIPNKWCEDQVDVPNKWYKEHDDQVDFTSKWCQDQADTVDSQKKWCQNQEEQIEVSNKWCHDQPDQGDLRNKWCQDKKDQMYVPHKWYQDQPDQLNVPKKWFKDELNLVDVPAKWCQDQLEFSKRWCHGQRTQDNKVAVFAESDRNYQRLTSPISENSTNNSQFQRTSNNNNNKTPYHKRGHFSVESEDRETSPAECGLQTANQCWWYPGLDIVVNDVSHIYTSGIPSRLPGLERGILGWLPPPAAMLGGFQPKYSGMSPDKWLPA